MFATQPPLLSIMNFSAIALCLLGAAVIIAPNACTASAASIESKSAKSDIFFSKSSKSNKSPKSSKSNKSPKSSKSESAAPTFWCILCWQYSRWRCSLPRKTHT